MATERSQKIKLKTLRNKTTVTATPARVFQALLSSREHGEFTKSPASISNKVGSLFSVYDGYASGKNVKLIPGKLIIQTWKAKDWPEGVVSTVTFELKPADRGLSTLIQFTQEGVPSELAEALERSWKEFYWDTMVKYFAK